MTGTGCRFATAAAAVLALILLLPSAIAAADARLYLRDRMQPLYIHNIKIVYARSNTPAEQIIILRRDQQNYASYSFREIRRLTFGNIQGYKNLHPVYSIRVHLETTAHWIDALLMPVRSISGMQGGRMWEYDVRTEIGHDENALQVQEIVFVNQS